MIIYSLIPCLYDETGHHYNYHKAFGEAIHLNNWKHIKYIPKKCKLSKLSKAWKKSLILHQGHKKKSTWNNFIKPLLNIFPFMKIFWKIRQEKGARSAFFLEYFTVFHLWALYLAIFFIRPKSSFWLLYRTDLDQIFLKGKMHKILHDKICKKIGYHNLVFFTDSELLSTQFESFFARKFFVLPIPHTKLYPNSNYQQNKDKKLVCWWPGGSIREEKGLKCIRYLSEKIISHNNVLIIVASAAKKFLTQSSKLKFIKTNINVQEYNNLMGSSDIILLPYSSSSYRFRTSGIFVEAITMGKIALTMKNTWMAYELEKYDLKELIIDWDDPNILQKFEKIYSNTFVRDKLKLMANEYVKFHNIESFAKKLKSFLGSGSNVM